MVHWSVHAGNGIGVPAFDAFGELADMTSQTVFIICLVLVSHGWGVTGKLLFDRIRLTTLSVLLALSYFVLFLWQRVGRDRASTLYLYDSVPGALIIVVRVGAFVWFMYSLLRTYRLEPDALRKNFYQGFGGFYGLWFWMLVFTVIVGAMFPLIDASADVYTKKFVVSIYETTNFVGFVFFVAFTWPSIAKHHFTFVQNTQRLIVENDNDEL